MNKINSKIFFLAPLYIGQVGPTAVERKLVGLSAISIQGEFFLL